LSGPILSAMRPVVEREHVAHEKAAGREAVDARHIPGSRVDVESTDPATGEKHLIEIKAFGGSGRGGGRGGEPNHGAPPTLYIVTDVRSADPSAIRILDLTGEQLHERLAAKQEKHYFEATLPVALYDELRAVAGDPSATE
jgi:hypothetical protein